ncbi:MAG: hypothetical protein AB1760_13525, partial [Pseudomonadota bacterium]
MKIKNRRQPLDLRNLGHDSEPLGPDREGDAPEAGADHDLDMAEAPDAAETPDTSAPAAADAPGPAVEEPREDASFRLADPASQGELTRSSAADTL